MARGRQIAEIEGGAPAARFRRAGFTPPPSLESLDSAPVAQTKRFVAASIGGLLLLAVLAVSLLLFAPVEWRGFIRERLQWRVSVPADQPGEPRFGAVAKTTTSSAVVDESLPALPAVSGDALVAPTDRIAEPREDISAPAHLNGFEPSLISEAASKASIVVAGGARLRTSGGGIWLDPDLPEYRPVQDGLSGRLTAIGSETLNNLMTYWTEDFQKIYPNVRIEVEGKGSSTAPPALIAGTAQLGPMSRKMTASELDKFEQKYGYKPRMVAVAIDALAVYVHNDNPLKSLTLQQADAIFSSTRKRGGQDIRTWGALGLTGEWANKPISLYGRNSASGAYTFFKERALLNGDYKSSVKEQPGSASVVQGIEKELGGIGYSGIGYKTSGVRALPIADSAGPIEATQQNAETFKYPISRYLYIYINVNPGSGPDPLVREFIRFVLSKNGQDDAAKDGYFPLPAKKAEEFLTSSGCK